MANIMVDLETLGTVPGCAILSIGAVVFSTRERTLGKEFYAVISRASCKEHGLLEDQGTIDWWSRQSADARAVIAEAEGATALSLPEALRRFNDFILEVAGTKSKAYVWGNGADFDNPLLACAYAAAEVKQGWASYNGRCYRTLKNLPLAIGRPAVPLARGGTHHNALDDAKTQAVHAIELINSLK